MRGRGQGGQAQPLADGRTELARQESLLSLLASSPRLQRQCACGAPSAGGGSCAACEANASLQGLQRKALEIGAADDPLEREADQVAERVMRMEVPPEPLLESTHLSLPVVLRTINPPTNPINIPIVGIGCYLESTEYWERFATDVLDQIEYDQDTMEWNRNEARTRGDWAQRLFDAWGHCYIAACMARQMPEEYAWASGILEEYLHEALSDIIGHDSLSQDLYNQAVGRQLARDHVQGDLYEIVFNAMINGRLDLTLAGVVPRGRSLRRRTTGS